MKYKILGQIKYRLLTVLICGCAFISPTSICRSEDKKTDMYEKISLPVLSWRPCADVTPGHITLIASGRLSHYGSITNRFFRLCEDAGFNVVQCGLDSSAHVINSINNAKGTSMKFFMRKGIGSIDIPLKKFSKLTPEIMTELRKVDPCDPFWNPYYDKWVQHVAEVLDYSNECIAKGEEDPLNRIAGCMIYDEPQVCYYWVLSELSHRLWDLFKEKRPDITPFIFSNLFGNFTAGSAPKRPDDAELINDLNRLSGGLNLTANRFTGYTQVNSYGDYVDQYVRMMNPALLSFDCYPFKIRGGKPVKNPMKSFFATLIEYQNRKIKEGMPFWAYVPCCRFVFSTVRDGVRVATDVEIPSPTLGRMRFEAFISLLYGATGLTYWGVTPGSPSDGFQSENPILADGTTTATYGNIKILNSQIKNLESILLSSDILTTCVTRNPPYTVDGDISGLKFFDSGKTHGVLKTVVSDGLGFVLAHMSNNGFDYIMAVNMDADDFQTGTFEFTGSGIELMQETEGAVLWNCLPENQNENSVSLVFEPGDIKVFRISMPKS